MINLTLEKKQNIFLMYPEVRRAFEAEVPLKMNESEFWHKYFKNEYYNAGMARDGRQDSSSSSSSYGGDDLFARYAVEKRPTSSSSSSEQDKESNDGLQKLQDHPVAPEFDLLSSLGDSYRKPSSLDVDPEAAVPQLTKGGGGAFGTYLDLSKTASKYNKNSELVMSVTESFSSSSSSVSASSSSSSSSSSGARHSSSGSGSGLGSSLEGEFTEQNRLAAPDYIPVSWTLEGKRRTEGQKQEERGMGDKDRWRGEGEGEGKKESRSVGEGPEDGGGGGRGGGGEREGEGEGEAYTGGGEGGAFAVSKGHVRIKRSFTDAGLEAGGEDTKMTRIKGAFSIATATASRVVGLGAASKLQRLEDSGQEPLKSAEETMRGLPGLFMSCNRAEKVFSLEMSKIQKTPWIYRRPVPTSASSSASNHGLPPSQSASVDLSSMYPMDRGRERMAVSESEVSEQFKEETLELYIDITELLRHFYGILNRNTAYVASGRAIGVRDSASIDKADAILKRLSEDKTRSLEARKKRIREQGVPADSSNFVDLTSNGFASSSSLLGGVDPKMEPYIAVLNELALLIRRAEITWLLFNQSFPT